MINHYALHKLIVIGFVAALVIITELVTPDQVLGWQLMLIAMIALGYTHFFIGGYYQYQAIRRRDIPRERNLFFIFSATSLVGGFILMQWLGMAVFVVSTLFYFMIHGYFNELTLFERQQGAPVPVIGIAVVMLIFVGLLLHGIGHPTWFFSPNLHFSSPTGIDIVPLTLVGVVTAAQWLGGLAFVAALLLAVSQLRKQFSVMTLLLIVGTIATAVYSLLYHPLPYVYLLVAVLLYHFVAWFVFYAEAFAKRDKVTLYNYLLAHLAIGGLLLGMSIQFGVYAVFSLSTFLIFTTWHITVSFLNEPWFKERFLGD